MTEVLSEFAWAIVLDFRFVGFPIRLWVLREWYTSRSLNYDVAGLDGDFDTLGDV